MYTPGTFYLKSAVFDTLGTANISEEQRNFASKYSVPLDCTWIIRVPESKNIYFQVFNLLVSMAYTTIEYININFQVFNLSVSMAYTTIEYINIHF